MESLVMFVLVCFAVNQIAGQCTFPSDLTGTWTTSGNGNITFTTSSKIDGMDLVLGGNTFQSWDCVENSGDKYLVRSSLTSVGSSGGGALDSYHYRCFEFHAVSSSIFYYYQLADFQSGVNQYVRALVGGDISTACTRDASSTEVMHNVMMKTDMIQSAAISCPSMIGGIFTYSVNGTQCAKMDSCTDKQMAFNITGCDDITYSSTGTVKCVVSLSRFGETYVSILNTDSTVDDSTTYRFSCYAMSKTAQQVSATVNPNDCVANQTSTSGGTATVLFDLFDSCPTSEDSSSNVAAIVVPIVLILVAAPLIALGAWYYLKKRKPSKTGMSDIDNSEKAKKNVAKETKVEKTVVQETPSNGNDPEKVTPGTTDVLMNDENIAPNNRLTPIQQ